MLVALGESVPEPGHSITPAAAGPSSLAVAPPPVLNRLTSQKGPQRIIAPTGDSSASSSPEAIADRVRLAALEKMKTVFFRTQKDLAELVHKTSTTLERHVIAGHIIGSACLEAAEGGARAFEQEWEERNRKLEQTKCVGEVDEFLTALTTQDARLTSSTVVTLTLKLLQPALTTYLLSSSSSAIRALASPDHREEVLSTAVKLSAFLTSQSLKDRLPSLIESRLKTSVDKWSKKVRKAWEEKRKGWIAEAGQEAKQEKVDGSDLASVSATTAPMRDATAASPSAITIPPTRRELVERQDVATRIRLTHDCCRQLLRELISSTPHPKPMDACQRLRQVLQSLAINSFAVVHTSIAAQTEYLRQLLLTPVQVAEGEQASMNLFHHVIVVLDAIMKTGLPLCRTDHERCWSIVEQLDRITQISATSAVAALPNSHSEAGSLSSDTLDRIRRITFPTAK